MKTKESNKQNDEVSPMGALQSEIAGHVILYIALSVMLQIAFYKESFKMVHLFLGSFYWLFILPGTSLLLPWSKSWGFVERVAAGTALAFAVVGSASYYIAIFGLHVKYHRFVFTPLLMVIGVGAFWFLSTRKNENSPALI